MGELWRSDEMELVQLFFQLEAAYDTMDELGELGVIQFKDMNEGVNQFQRHFANEIKRAYELERKLRFFQVQLEMDQGVFEGEISHLEFYGDVELGPMSSFDMSELEELETELLQITTNVEAMARNLNELAELEQVLAKGVDFFSQAGDGLGHPEEDLLDDLPDDEAASFRGITQLGFITGIIETSKLQTFERVLWRATLGNLFMKHTAVDAHLKGLLGDDKERAVFIIFYQGPRLQDKITKICQSFNANVYPCPDSPRERLELLDQVRGRITDLREVMRRSAEAKYKILSSIAPQVRSWKLRLMKEKAIHASLNLCNFDVGRKCLIAEGWVPKLAIPDAHAALKRAQQRSDSPIPSILNVLKTQDEPPTQFRVNKFTSAFQGIVDAYGMARYREINPGVFTIISFPFLFGIMFGDVGHGGLVFLYALFLVLREKHLSRIKLNETISYHFNGRYLLLLMGFFSIYCGFIYNEFFAIPMNIFGSRWVFKDHARYATWEGYDTAYPFGVDPAWKGSKNELVFYNSLKMKLSIIFGVTQMCFGIILSLFNALYFKKYYNVYWEFIPQMVFMLSIFGYMCLLIIVKWCTDYPNNGKPAPYLLNVMIDMFLHPLSLPESNQLFSGQLGFQVFFLIIAIISVPCMLFVKPFLLRRDHKRRLEFNAMASPPSLMEEDEFSLDAEDSYEEEEFDFGEVFIHQVIHTIEFVLGGISNTASYLRLWALSLAHSELATVFWDRIMIPGFKYSNVTPLAPLFAFGAWAVITFSIIINMEGLSAFLHALRLHWVEFQNKFYIGDGRRFTPFSYKDIQENETDSS